jgi:hypothetical protein
MLKFQVQCGEREIPTYLREAKHLPENHPRRAKKALKSDVKA